MTSVISIETINTYNLDQTAITAAFNAASEMHDKWRANYIVEKGNIPRVKTTSDGSCDINQPFKDIHPDYQKANITMAEFVIKMIIKLFPLSDKTTYYHLIHEFWLTQNSYALIDPLLNQSWVNLSESEQAKDILVFDICSAHYLQTGPD